MQISKKKYPFCHSGYQYACDVIEKKINVPIAVKGTVKRFFRDLEEKDKFHFDIDVAERFLRLVQKFHHVKGANWGSKNITYEPWQNFTFMYLMGFISNETGRRRFRSAYVQIARGQGKSLLASQIGLYFLALEGEIGPEVVCA